MLLSCLRAARAGCHPKRRIRRAAEGGYGQRNDRNQKYITIRIFAPLLRVAASVLLIVGLGVSIFFITRENNKPGFVETYDDPNAAIKDASSALEVLSYALQKTEEASLQTLRTIDDLDIDWSALDSLSSTASGNDTLHDSTFMTTEKKEENI